MGGRTSLRPSLTIDWAVEARPLSGQTRSGDAHVVTPFPGGILIGVVDGLGHGEDAGTAADSAVDALGTDADQPVELLVKRCHQALRGTRGAVMSLASIRLMQRTMSWIGIGNVEAVLVRDGMVVGNHHIVSRGGIVGYSLPPLVSTLIDLQPSDVLIFATDGIRAGFAQVSPRDEEPRTIAAGILETHGLDADDALVLVARVGEGSS
jgi:negative regulator of sigma-B (phosphoserine phosphatase)